MPLSIVTVRKSGVAAAADDLGGGGLQLELVAQLEQPLQAAAAIGQRALLLQLDLRRRQLLLQLVVLLLDMAQADVSAPHAAHARDAADTRAALRRTRRR